jgi:hypothetical protein
MLKIQRMDDMRKLLGATAALWLAGTVAAAQVPDRPVLRPVRYDIVVRLDLADEVIDASARIRLRNESARPLSEASFLLYRLLNVQRVLGPNGKPLSFDQKVVAVEDFSKQQVNHVRVPLAPALPAGKETTIELRYGGHLLGYSETGMLYVQDRIDSAYTLLREDAYAYPIPAYPSLGSRRRAGLPTFEYTARVTVPSTYSVANGGELVARTLDGAMATFVYRSAMPSWRMDFAVAPFQTIAAGNLTVFHLPEDSLGARRIFSAMQRTLALYTRWFGPLAGARPFAVIEIPDGWGSQADVTSLLQAAAAFRDPKREYELYHEISHLWNPPSTDKPSPRWNEGLASFLEDLTTDTLTGRASMDSSAMRLARWLAERVRTDSSLRIVAPVDFGKRDMTGYSYSVGNLMFFGLYRLVGHEAFCRIVGDYYRTFAATGGGTADFVRLARSLSGVDLTTFFDDWLYSTRWANVVSAASGASDLFARYQVNKGR